MAEPVTIPISYFEVAADYERPQFQLWLDRAAVISAVFDALHSWEPTIDDVAAIITGKTSEQGFTIKLPLKRVSFFFGAASCKFTRENSDWQSAEETIAIFDAGISALIHAAGVNLGPKRAVIALHLQPKSVPFIGLLSPFIPPQLAALEAEPATTMATVAKWPYRKITIDGSGLVANAIFLRFEREFPTTASYDEMARQLRKDEEDLFTLLGVEEDRRMNAYVEVQTAGIEWPDRAAPFLSLALQEKLRWQNPQQPPAVFEELERQMAQFAAEQQAMLNDVRKLYVLPSDSSVTEFLARHRAIPQILVSAAPHLKACFGVETIFSLRAPLDDSGSQTLYAVVMWSGRVEDVRRALARFDQEWWMERAGQGAGYLTFTYELT